MVGSGRSNRGQATDPAFDELFRREYRALVAELAVVLGSSEQAREVAQEAFAAAAVRWGQVGQLDRPGAWVRKVALRKAFRAARRERRRPVLEADSAGGRSPVADPGVGPDVDAVRMAVASLPPQQRAAVALHYLRDLPIGEVAEAIGCSEATARVHLHRARARLAELLDPEVHGVG